MLAVMSNIRIVFSLEFIHGSFEALGFVLVQLGRLSGLIEKFVGPLELAFQTLHRRLRIRKLRPEFLEGDFEIPIFLLVFVYNAGEANSIHYTT